jgi:protein SCO1/2
MKWIIRFCFVCLAFMLVACAPKPTFNGVDITGADYANGFVFRDQSGRALTIDSFKGQVVALFFGYTQCPDVCPTTMTEFAKLKSDLGESGSKLQVLFVSVDPERDTPDILKAYMTNFDASFLGYSPTPAELEQVTKNFKIYYKKVTSTSSNPKIYTVDHSAGTYLFDTQGRIRLFIRYGMPPESLKQDISTLLKEGV